MAYMVPHEELMAHLLNNKDEAQDVSCKFTMGIQRTRLTLLQASTCVDFDAIKQASTKNAGLGGSSKQKFRTTGVVGASCACSEMLTPNGVGDLQFGERQVVSKINIITTNIDLR